MNRVHVCTVFIVYKQHYLFNFDLKQFELYTVIMQNLNLQLESSEQKY